MTTRKRISQITAWLALAAFLLSTADARAQWMGRFTGEVIEVNDPDDRFQGVIQIGTPVSGEYNYTIPFGRPGNLSLGVGAAVLTSLEEAWVSALAYKSGWDFFYFEAFTWSSDEFERQKWTPNFGPEAKLGFSGSAGGERKQNHEEN